MPVRCSFAGLSALVEAFNVRAPVPLAPAPHKATAPMSTVKPVNSKVVRPFAEVRTVFVEEMTLELASKSAFDGGNTAQSQSRSGARLPRARQVPVNPSISVSNESKFGVIWMVSVFSI